MTSLCILDTDPLICPIFGKHILSNRQSGFASGMSNQEAQNLVLCYVVERGGGAGDSTHLKAKMSSSLPFYTLKICVLISPGSEKGVAWPAPCPGLCRAFFLEAVIGASHQKRGPE